jgi:hypothetical protein
MSQLVLTSNDRRVSVEFHIDKAARQITGVCDGHGCGWTVGPVPIDGPGGPLDGLADVVDDQADRHLYQRHS